MKSISILINAHIEGDMPGHLLRPFAGTTLLDIALGKIDQASRFDRRLLAAAGPEALEKAGAYPNVDAAPCEPGGEPYAHLSRIESDYIFILNPSLPFVELATINRAFDEFQEKRFASFTSATPSRDWIFDEANNALTNSDPTNVTTNVGRLFFKAAHAFHIVNKADFLERGRFWSMAENDPHLIAMDEKEAIAIGDEIEFEYSEYAYRKRVLSESE